MKSKRLLILLLMALLVPWAANAQDVEDYTFSTGESATQWITMNNPTDALSGYHDDDASSKIDLGITFPFGNSSYTQFWVNSNGAFSFSSSPVGGSTTSMFTSSGYSSAQPKICGIARDLGTGNGGYVKYQLTGTAPNRIFVCEFAMAYKWGDDLTPDLKWQVQLYESDSKVVIVYGSEPEDLPYEYQIGLSQSSTDIWTVNPETHVATHSTGSVSTTYGTSYGIKYWPGANRYYQFVRPVIAYPKPGTIQVTGTDHESASFSWTAPAAGSNTLTGYAYQYKLASETDWPTNWTNTNSTATTLTIHGLTASKSYNFRLVALYGDNQSESVTTNFATTAQATAVGDSWSDDFEGESCGWDTINGTQTNKWAWGTATNNGGTHALYISNDNGANNAYNLNSTTIVFATKLLNFTEGKFEFAYDWKCMGESTTNATYYYDYLRVALVPASATFTAGTMPSGFNGTALPSSWISLDGGHGLKQQDTWKHGEAVANVTAGNYYLALVWRNDSGGGSNPPAAVDNVSITRVACPYDVTGLTVSGITTSGATLNWTAGEATQWQVAYATTSNFASATEAIVSAATYPMTSLTDATHYYVRVRAYCGGSDYGSWSSVVEFDTKCLPTTVPSNGWTENFDGYSLTSAYTPTSRTLPSCWSYINTCTYNDYKYYPTIYYYSYTNYANSTPNCLRFYSVYSANYDPQPQYAILPQMDNLDGMRIKLQARGYNATSTFKIGRMTDPDDVSTFVPFTIGEGNEQALTTSYQEFIYNLTGNGNYIAIMIDAANSSRTYNGVYIDDIRVEPIPSCTEPSAITVPDANITSNSAQVGWTAGGNELAWDIYYSTTNTAPTGSTTPSVSATANNPETITGLTHSTIYYVWVRAHCSDSDQSPWVGGVRFQTDCGTVTTFPFVQDFNSLTNNSEIPVCWDNNDGSNFSYDYYKWCYYNGTSSGGTTGTGHNNTNCVRFNSYSPSSGLYNCLKTPVMNLPEGKTMQLTFWYKNPAGGDFSVYISTDGGSTYTTSLVTSLTDKSSWTEQEIVLGDYVGTENVVIVFKGTSNCGYGDAYIYLDDVTVAEAPSCFKPSALMLNTPTGSLTAHTATLKWTNGSEGQEAWQIIYDTVMFNPDTLNLEQMSATLVNVTTNPATIDGLKNNKMYYAYVRANCGDGDYSKWNSQVRSFTTKSGKDKPTNLAVIDSTITNNQARVRWKGAATNDLHQYYQLYYSCLSTLPETLLEDSLISPISDTSYLFSNLDSEKKYYVWVRDYCGNDGYSVWTSSINFTTLADCPAPTITVSTPTAHGATVAWTGGFSDTYTVWYQEPSYVLGVSTDFTSDPTTNWVNGSGVLNETDGTATITSGSCWYFTTNCGVFDRHAYFNMYTAKNYWLVTPKTTIPQGYTFSFDVAYTKYSSSGVNNPAVTGGPHRLLVLISTDNKAHWTILREWNNTGSDYVLDNIAQTGQTVSDISLDNYVGQEVYVAFLGISSTTDYDNNIHLDNIIVGKTVAATGWEVAAQGITQSPCVLNDATIFAPETDYEVKVTGICGEAQSEPSNVVGFTTTATCTAPEGLVVSDETTTGATFTWTAVEGVNFQYVYGAATQTPDFTNASSTTGNRVVVDDANLEPNTSYVFYLRKDCGDDDYSEYRLAAFRTACGEEPVPYTYGFEEEDKFECWTPFAGVTRSESDYYSTPYNDSYQLKFYGNNSSLVALPAIDAATNTLRMEFYTRPESTSSYCGKFAVGYMTNLADASSFHAIDTFLYSEWTSPVAFDKRVVDFNVDADNDGVLDVPANAYIAMLHFDCSTNYGWYVDDVTVKPIPSCEEPEVAEVTDITPTSATLNWTGEHESFNVQYRTAVTTGETYFFEGFENGIPTTWTTIDADGDGNNWLAISEIPTVYSAGYADEDLSEWPYDGIDAAASASFINTSISSGTSLDSDHWLISPQLSLQGMLKFYAVAVGDYGDEFEVLLSTTTAETTAFTTTLREMMTATGSYKEISIDLSEYAGQQGYIAIHHVFEDGYFLVIDNFGIYELIEAGEWSDPVTVTENNYPLDNLDSETEYEWQVQGICESSESIWVAGDNFTTLSVCVAPVADSATNITYNSAELYWTGYQENYNVRYRVSAFSSEPLFTEDFADGELGDWTTYNLNSINYSGTEYTSEVGEGYFEFLTYGATSPQYLVSPELEGLTEGGYLYFEYMTYSSYIETFKIGFSSTTNEVDGDAFTWSKTYTLIDEEVESTSGYFSIEIPAGTKYFAIQSTSTGDYSNYFIVSDFMVYGPNGEWQYANNVTSPASIDELEDGTLYEWQVQGAGCADSDWSNSLYFQTEEQTTVTQRIELAAGWNWVSIYLENEDSEEMMLMLQEALGENGLQIVDKDDFTTYADGEWGDEGELEELSNDKMYMIQTSAACTVELKGMPGDPADYPITIKHGWNWIGFPSAEAMRIEDAFADFEAEDDDMIVGKFGYTTYVDEWGDEGDLEVLTPGEGYMYYYNGDEQELVIQTRAKARRAMTNMHIPGNLVKAVKHVSDPSKTAKVEQLNQFKTKK